MEGTTILTAPLAPLDDFGNCLWCGEEPDGPLCCKGNHPDRHAVEREYAYATVIILGGGR